MNWAHATKRLREHMADFCLRRADYRWVFYSLPGVVVFGLGLRILRYWRDPMISRDGIYYLKQAQGWLTCGFESVYDSSVGQPPLLLRFIHWGYWLGLDWDISGVTVNILLGTLTIVASYWMLTAINHIHRNIAVLGALLVASNPILVSLSTEIQRETGFMLFFILTTGALLRGWLTGKQRWWIYGGFFAALGMLFRYEMVDGFFLLLLLLVFNLRKNTFAANLRIMFFFGVSFALTLVVVSCLLGIPWAFYEESVVQRIRSFLS